MPGGQARDDFGIRPQGRNCRSPIPFGVRVGRRPRSTIGLNEAMRSEV